MANSEQREIFIDIMHNPQNLQNKYIFTSNDKAAILQNNHQTNQQNTQSQQNNQRVTQIVDIDEPEETIDQNLLEKVKLVEEVCRLLYKEGGDDYKHLASLEASQAMDQGLFKQQLQEVKMETSRIIRERLEELHKEIQSRQAVQCLELFHAVGLCYETLTAIEACH